MTAPRYLSDANVNSRISLLHVIPNFFPATRWGGPIFSTKAICDGVAAVPGVTLRVITTDAAGPARNDTLPLMKRKMTMDAGYEVTYYHRNLRYSISPGLLLAMVGAIRAADVVHVTSTYSFPTLPALALAKLMGRPVIWSPRGAIQASAEWDDAPRQRLKRGFERLAAMLAPRITALHVTADSEAAATGCRMPGFPMAVIPNSIEMPDAVDRLRRPAGRTRLMFLSRVHEKKGLSLLITALSGLPESVTLDIYGTGEPAYLDRLHAEIAQAGLTERVAFQGHVDGAAKTRAFAAADLLVLPSYSENFGIVVAEALAHGLPVITTDRTPWGDLERNGCGLCVSPDIPALRDAIHQLSHADLTAMGARGQAWMKADFSPKGVHSAMHDLYAAAIAAQRDGQPLRLRANT